MGVLIAPGALYSKRDASVNFFVAKASHDNVLVGVGFVPDDDSDNTDQAILAAIELWMVSPPRLTTGR